MKIKTLGWLIAAAAVASSASIVACSQAAVQCQAGHAGSGLAYAVKYYPVGTPGAACAAPGDEIGFETYHPPGGGDDGSQPDFSIPSIVSFRNASMGAMIAAKAAVGSVDPDGTNVENPVDGTHTLAKRPAYSLGTFATVEPVNDFCPVVDPKAAEQQFPLVPKVEPDPADPEDMGSPEVPASSVKYEWSDVKVYVTAAAQGTQFSGHLKYSQDASLPNACAAEYDVVGVWPSVFCGVTKEVDDGMGGTMEIDVPEPSLCCPSADPLGGRIIGSGINPDFPMVCDPDLLLCVLDTKDAKSLPVLKPGWDADSEGVLTGACKITPPSSDSTSTGM
jgi:hypothetical protein